MKNDENERVFHTLCNVARCHGYPAALFENLENDDLRWLGDVPAAGWLRFIQLHAARHGHQGGARNVEC